MVRQKLHEEEDCDKQQNIDYDIRILLVGDSGTGKTSLIYSLVNDEFEPNLPFRMGPIILAPEATADGKPIQIVDYSARDQSEYELNEAIKNATVICIVYDSNDDDGLNRVVSYWIPKVRACQKDRGTYKPIILVANKIDLIEDLELAPVSMLIQEFADIETFIEVSALNQKNVVELFSSAQKAINYPLAPLFDPQMRILTKKCQSALIEIFNLSDLDGDGLLNDHELNLFQENCFGTPLHNDALADLKMIIKQSTIDGIINNGLTQAGFLFLHALSIDKGRLDFTWQVLRKFDYDNHVNAKQDLSSNPLNDTSILNPGASTLRTNSSSSSKFDETEKSSIESSDHVINMRSLDISWIRENKNIVKVGIGITFATLLSFLTIKHLTRISSKN